MITTYNVALECDEVKITVEGQLDTLKDLRTLDIAQVTILKDQTTLKTEDENSDPCRCKYCGLQHETKEELDEHVRTIHGKEDEET